MLAKILLWGALVFWGFPNLFGLFNEAGESWMCLLTLILWMGTVLVIPALMIGSGVEHVINEIKGK